MPAFVSQLELLPIDGDLTGGKGEVETTFVIGIFHNITNHVMFFAMQTLVIVGESDFIKPRPPARELDFEFIVGRFVE